MFRKIRILILLLILASVGLGAWRSQQRLGSWKNTFHVALYPIAGDTSAVTRAYLDQIKVDTFTPLNDWLKAEGLRYELTLHEPLQFRLAARLTDTPPQPPQEAGLLNTMLWSLHLRWWAWRHDKVDGPRPDIRLFVLFHDPEISPRLKHSVGLSKGQIGLIHLFAKPSQEQQNQVVLSHELLHIFGASDKYDPHNLQPLFPEGYAEPLRQPPLPQLRAEIMGGRVPLSSQEAVIPASLRQTVIGAKTASEIGWPAASHSASQ